VTKKPTKTQVRAQAVAERQRASEAAAKQRRNRTILWGGLAVVVVIAIVVAVVASGGSNDSASATKFETAAVTVSGTPLPDYDAQESPDPAVGEAVPTLEGKSVDDGSPVTIGPDSGGGEPQMIVFVAHWCPHCQAEVPRLVELAKDGVFDGVKVSAVATSTSEEAPNYPPSAWLQDEDWTFPVLADSKTGTAARAYGLTAFPYFVLVNADGTVAGRGTGELPEDQIKANIKALKAGDELPISSSSKSSSAN
jgi:cytochrome c biogenesis protein CcmG, thiol:disulfide interchange protein DsbE